MKSSSISWFKHHIKQIIEKVIINNYNYHYYLIIIIVAVVVIIIRVKRLVSS